MPRLCGYPPNEWSNLSKETCDSTIPDIGGQVGPPRPSSPQRWIDSLKELRGVTDKYAANDSRMPILGADERKVSI
jgi:hypothetical protein